MQHSPLFAFAADNGFVVPLVVAVTSLAANCVSPIKVAIITTDIPRTTRKRIAAVFHNHAPEESTLDWLELDSNHLSGFPLGMRHLSPLTYARLLLPGLIGAGEGELVYLDCDTVINGNLAAWVQAEPLQNLPIAAVRDFIAPHWNSSSGLPYLAKKIIGIEKHHIFNAGVMRIDIRPWLDLDVVAGCRAFITEYGSKVKSDQDALNFVLRDRWQPLHPKWNMQSKMGASYELERELVDKIEKVSLSDDAIIHFCTSHKPWNSGLRGNKRIDLWLKALRNSGWFTPAEYYRWQVWRYFYLVKKAINRRGMCKLQ